MLLERPREPLRSVELDDPAPGPGQVLVSVDACGVCRTDLHILDGELAAAEAAPRPGAPDRRQGRRGRRGRGALRRRRPGRRPLARLDLRRVPLLPERSREPLRPGPLHRLRRRRRLRGAAVADERYCFAIPDGQSDEQAAPLLCAGLIGYRALRLVGDAERIGFYGFGASAHILCQVAVHQGRRVFAFTRPGDEETQEFARGLGAAWAGSSEETPPEELDGAIVFAPVGALMPAALRATAKGARVISAGIHMSEIPAFPYEFLWGERTLGSVANLTRADGEEFLELAPRVPGAHRGRPSIRSPTRTLRSRTCAAAPSPGPRSSRLPREDVSSEAR